MDGNGRLAISKFPSVHDQRAVTKGAVLALRLAARAEIDAAEARLVSSDGVAVTLVRRFDRTSTGQRIPFISAATFIRADPNDEQVHFYAEIVDALRQHGAAARVDIEQLWRRLVFSILITNVDDHLRNHGLLHAEHGLWWLALAFDMNPFPDRARELKTWPAEETSPKATMEAALVVSRFFGLRRQRGAVENGGRESLCRWCRRCLSKYGRHLERRSLSIGSSPGKLGHVVAILDWSAFRDAADTKPERVRAAHLLW